MMQFGQNIAIAAICIFVVGFGILSAMMARPIREKED